MTIPRGVWIALGLITTGVVAVAMWWTDERAHGVPIRIAFAGPTSGPGAGDGLSAVRAIKLLFDRVNAEGGVNGRPLVLDVYDDRNDPARARANAPGIADELNTIAVIGHNYSTCSIAAGEISAARGISAVATAATSAAVTQDNHWYYRTIFNDLAQGRFIVVYIREILGAEHFSIVHESDIYGTYLGGVIEDGAPQAGLTLMRSWSFDPASAKLDARLDEIARETVVEAPEVLVLALQPKAGVAFVKCLPMLCREKSNLSFVAFVTMLLMKQRSTYGERKYFRT